MPNPLSAAADWPVPAASVAVTTARRTLAMHGEHDARHPLASVTKPLAAWAALVAVEHGHLDLDAPVSHEALGDVGREATLAHLLAHASGLPYEQGAPQMAPGRRRVYSNLGYDVIGEVVAAAVGRPFDQWLREAVLDPLGMDATALDGSPAKDGHGTVRDLLAFGRELLAPTLLSPELHRRATTPAFAELDGVLPGYGRQSPNPWGLGVEVRGDKAPHWTGPDADPATFGHFGQSGSFLWVDPTAGLACACLTGTAFGQWAVDAWAPFNQAVLDHWSD